MQNRFCVLCQLGKARRAKVAPTTATVVHPLELVHTDIAGTVVSSMAGSIYSLCFVDSFTAKFDVFFLKKKFELPKFLKQYKTKSELETGFPLRKIRLDGAVENMSGDFETFCLENGIEL